MQTLVQHSSRLCSKRAWDFLQSTPLDYDALYGLLGAAAAAQCRTGVHYMKHQHLTVLALNGLVWTLIELMWNSVLWGF
jgi:hypothetical protein